MPVVQFTYRRHVHKNTRGGTLMRLSRLAKTTLFGIIGGVLFGAVIHFWMMDMVDVGAMYGVHSVILGWIAHLAHSVIGAIVLTSIVSRTSLRGYAMKRTGKVAIGLGYGFVLWTVFIVLILPIWLDVMTQWGGGIPIKNSELRFPESFLGFLLYGSIVGGGIQLPPSTVGQIDSETSVSAGD